MRHLIYITALTLSFGLISQAATEVTGIAAIANGQVVTKRELAMGLAPLRNQLLTRYPRRGPIFQRELKKALDSVLNELIDRQLIMVEFKEKATGTIPQTTIERSIDREIQDFYNGSEEEFRKELTKMRMTRAKYENLTREKLIVQAMRSQHFNEAAPPTPDEIRAEYNSVKKDYRDIRQDKVIFEKIFIPKALRDRIVTPEEQLTLAEDLVAKIKDGANFAELAKAHSADSYSENGGKSEEVDRVDLSTEFATIIFEEPLGTLIGPIAEGPGYTIVRTIKITEGPVPPFEKLRSLMERRVQAKKNNKGYLRWIKAVRERAIIKRKI